MANLTIRRSPWRAPNTSLFDRDFFAPSMRRMLDTMNATSLPLPTQLPEALGVMPAVEIAESNGEFICTAELPGLKEKDVDVAFSEDALTIKGEKHEERETKEDKRYHLWERSYGAFERTFTFPTKVDAEKIHAEFKNGVLTVTLPKLPNAKAQGRAIPVVTK